MDTLEFKNRFMCHYAKVYRVAFAITGNSQDAEDVTQNLYTKLFTSKAKLKSVKNPEAYLVKLAKNLAIDLTRTQEYRNRTQKVEITSPNLINGVNPERNLELKDELTQIYSIIEQLPTNQQQALRLHAIEGMEYQEIQEIMGISCSNLRTLISRARKFITIQLKKDEEY